MWRKGQEEKVGSSSCHFVHSLGVTVTDLTLPFVWFPSCLSSSAVAHGHLDIWDFLLDVFLTSILRPRWQSGTKLTNFGAIWSNSTLEGFFPKELLFSSTPMVLLLHCKSRKFYVSNFHLLSLPRRLLWICICLLFWCYGQFYGYIVASFCTWLNSIICLL